MTKTSSILKNAYRFSVAPMLDCTDSHFRVLMRQITKRSLLYTEMIVAQAIHYSNKKNLLLDFNEIEHPISLQLGGDDPILLSNAAKLAEEWGYDEINLNIGCPSQKVQSGNFGACLMANPEKVARCVEAMANRTHLPITVKHRIGIDSLDSYKFLEDFVNRLAESGVKRFSIHARKALLQGLSPKENRIIPPLNYEKVFRLKRNNPKLIIELNGGLINPNECLKVLKNVDGAMVGRAAYQNPLLWSNMDKLIYGDTCKSMNASKAIKGIIPHAEKHISKGGRLWNIARHTLNLVQNVSGARAWRNAMTIEAQKPGADINILINAMQRLEDAGL